jgi:N-acetylmuramic acid 6-phosphate etherase
MEPEHEDATPPARSHQILLGIDGGGSKTAAQIATIDGRPLGTGRRGASNYQAVGLEAALDALNGAINAACEEAGIAQKQINAICLGLAGVDRPEDRDIFARWLAERMPGIASIIVNDAHLLLAAGTPQGWGIALICGTGSICIGRSPDGALVRVDGWGHILGDQGSGYAIGRLSLQAAMKAYDGRGPATTLLPAILDHWQLPNAEALIARVYQQQASTTEIAALSRLTDAAAEAGDPVAQMLLSTVAQELALNVATAAARLGIQGPIPCALAGGVITRSEFVRTMVLEGAEERGVILSPVQPVFEPVLGAVRLARKLLEENGRVRRETAS